MDERTAMWLQVPFIRTYNEQWRGKTLCNSIPELSQKTKFSPTDGSRKLQVYLFLYSQHSLQNISRIMALKARSS